MKCTYTGSHIDSYIISDFGLVSWRGSGVEKILALLRCYITLVCNFTPTFRDSYESHLQQHSSPESSIRDYKPTLRNIAEDLRHQLHCSGIWESRDKIYALILSQMKEIIHHITKARQNSKSIQ